MNFKRSYLFLGIFIFILSFSLYDIIVDIRDGLTWKHLSHEIGIVFFSSILIIYQIKLMFKNEVTIKNIKTDNLELSSENIKIKSELKKLSGKFQEVIDEQLKIWNLSASEMDIAKFILKGLNMKEIANIRNTSEATVRQQAMHIYKKANVNNRQEFIAFFLEDL